MTSTVATIEQIRPLLAEARSIFAEMGEIELALGRDYDRLCASNWRLGASLEKIKTEVGHGRWLFWLGANWPELGEKRAQRCMAFFRENAALPNPTNLSDFDSNSIRKLLGNYIPAKERPKIEGDTSVPPARHHLTCVNQLATWSHRLEIGLIKPPELAELRRDFEQPLRNLIGVLGREWIESLLQ